MKKKQKKQINYIKEKKIVTMLSVYACVSAILPSSEGLGGKILILFDIIAIKTAIFLHMNFILLLNLQLAINNSSS